MQPKTKNRAIKNMTTIKSGDTIKNGDTIYAVSEASTVKKPLPAEQWDQLAFTLIRQELAPKGFSEIKRGPWRGKVQSNIPFLPKVSVERCQKGAAQLVRAYRDKVRRELEGRMKDADVHREQAAKDLDKCQFWQFGLKRSHREAYVFYRDQVGLLQILINQLDNIGIK